MHLCQLMQYSHFLMQLCSNRPSSPTGARLTRRRRRDGDNGRQQNRRRESFRAQRHQMHAIVTDANNSSRTEMGKTRTNFQGNVLGAASLAISQVSHCRVCLVRDHTMTKCAYTVNVEKLTATGEIRWQKRPPYGSEARSVSPGKENETALNKKYLEPIFKTQIWLNGPLHRKCLSLHQLVNRLLQTSKLR